VKSNKEKAGLELTVSACFFMGEREFCAEGKHRNYTQKLFLFLDESDIIATSKDVSKI
jgi:hypothetical protein